MPLDVGQLVAELVLDDRFNKALRESASAAEDVFRRMQKDADDFGKSGTDAFKKVSDEAERATKKLSNVDDSLNAMQLTAVAAAGAVGGFLGSLSGQVINSFVGAVKSAALALPELVLKGAAVSDVAENFERLATSAGHASEVLLGELRRGTHSTIDDFTLMKRANENLAAGLNLTDQQFGTLAKGAFALSQATGVDVKHALDTMSDAMLTGRTRAVALLTGKIDLERAEESYARSIGTVREALTEEGKLEAARKAILDAVTDSTKRLGDQTDGLDEFFAQAQTAWANFQNELGKTIATSPTLITLLGGVRDIVVDAFGPKQEDLVKAVASAIDRAAVSVVDFAKVAIQAGADAAKEWYALKKIIGDVVQFIEIEALGVEQLSLKLAKGMAKVSFGPAFEARQNDIKRIQENIDYLTKSINERADSLAADDAAQANVDKTTAKWGKTLDELRAKMLAAGSANNEFVGPVQKTIGVMGQATNVTSRLTKITQEQISEQKKFAAAWEELAQIGGKVDDELSTIDKTTLALARDYLSWGARAETVATALHMTSEQVNAVKESLKAEAVFLKEQDALFRAASVSGDKFNETLKNLNQQPKRVESTATAGVVPLMPDLSKAGKRFVTPFADEMKAGMHDLFANDVPATILRAIEGGGNVFAAAGTAIGQKIGANLTNAISTKFTDPTTGITKIFGKSFGADSIFGGLLSGGVSAAIGAGVSLLTKGISALFHIGGPSKEEVSARDQQAQLVEQLKAIATDAQKAEGAFTDTYHTLAIVARDVFLIGESAEEADKHVQDLLNTHDPEAFARGLESVNSALSEINDIKRGASVFGASQQELEDDAKRAQKVFEYMRDSGQYTAEQLSKAWKAMEDAQRRAAGELVDATEEQAAAVDKTSDSLQALKDKFKSLSDSIANEAPEEVMGVIEQQTRAQMDALQKQIEEAGKSIKGETKDGARGGADAVADAAVDMQKQFDDVGNRAKQVADQITNYFGDLRFRIPIDFDWHAPSIESPEVVQPPGFATGGIVPVMRESRVLAFEPRGRDTSFIAATPGEGILTPAATNRVGADVIEMLNRGGSLRDVAPSQTPTVVRQGPDTLQIYIGGRLVKETVIGEMESAPTDRDKRVLKQMVR